MNELTEREKRIFELIMQGLSNSKIIIEMPISQSTFYRDLQCIKYKFSVKNKRELIEKEQWKYAKTAETS